MDNTKNIIAVRQELLKRLKEERINQGLSQKDMVQKTGLSPAAISQMENGTNPRLSSLLLYLKALNKLEALNELIPEPGAKPTDLVKLGKPRQRVSRKTKVASSKWKWGDEQ